MNTRQLLMAQAEFEKEWNLFYKRCRNNPVLPLMGEEWHEDFMQHLNAAGIELEDAKAMLERADEELKESDQDATILAHSEAKFERQMEQGIVRAETSFEPDAHTFTPGDGL